MLGLMSERVGTGWSVSYRIPTWLWWDVVFVTGEGLLVAGGVVFLKVGMCYSGLCNLKVRFEMQGGKVGNMCLGGCSGCSLGRRVC